MFEFRDSLDSAINPSIKLIALGNRDMTPLFDCELSKTFTKSCEYKFEVEAFVGEISFGYYTTFSLHVQSECLNVDFTKKQTWGSAYMLNNVLYYDIWQVKDFDKDDTIIPLNPATLKNENYEISIISEAVQYYLPRVYPQLDSTNALYVELEPGMEPYPDFSAECGTVTYTLIASISEVGQMIVTETTGYPVLQIESRNNDHSGQNKKVGFKKKYDLTIEATLTNFPELGVINYDLTRSDSQTALYFTM